MNNNKTSKQSKTRKVSEFHKSIKRARSKDAKIEKETGVEGTSLKEVLSQDRHNTIHISGKLGNGTPLNIGKDVREMYKSQKIESKTGNGRKIATAKDVTIVAGIPKSTEKKLEKAIRFSKLPFSKEHTKMVAKASSIYIFNEYKQKKRQELETERFNNARAHMTKIALRKNAEFKSRSDFFVTISTIGNDSVAIKYLPGSIAKAQKVAYKLAETLSNTLDSFASVNLYDSSENGGNPLAPMHTYLREDYPLQSAA